MTHCFQIKLISNFNSDEARRNTPSSPISNPRFSGACFSFVERALIHANR